MIDPVAWVKTNWRIVLLIVLLGASAYFLFVPGAPIAGTAADAGDDVEGDFEVADDVVADEEEEVADTGWTNIQYGIQLDGGARISAPVHGLVVEDVSMTVRDPDLSDEERQEQTQQREREVTAAVEEAMTNVSAGDIVTYTLYDGFDEEDVVEVRVRGGDPAELAQGLQDAGYDVTEEDVQRGVTDSTRSSVVEVLDARLGEAGFGGGSVTQSHGGDEPRVVVEAPGRNIEDLEALIEERGLVQLVAHYPDGEGGWEEQEVFRQEHIEGDPGVVQRDDAGQPYVPVTVTQQGAQQYTNIMDQGGFLSPEGHGPGACGYVSETHGDQEPPDDGYGYCLFVKIDGERVWGGNLAAGLAESIESSSFEEERQFRMTTTDTGDAQQLRLNLIAGELPAEVDLDRSNEFLFNPALAEGFKTNSLLTGILAVFAVVLMVFLRYGDPRVAVPMSATALSEVVILLGFAAAIGLPLDLSHVAGFIAVIGTGVDDLIIIADEVMSEGEVSSHHVFDSRFRKAFWVIGAAAATTILAMSPLAVMDLGDLRGFAIVTILGVIIGVAVTRPAYGNILRALKTEGR